MMAPRSLSLLAVAGIVACASANGGAGAARNRSGCDLTSRDSSYLARGLVYRECAVDDKAKLLTTHPRFDFQPSASDPSCLAADLEFVVDTLGAPEIGSVQVLRATTRAFGEAVAATIPTFLYEPARLEGMRVRQIVSYRQTAMLGRVVVPMGGAPPTTGRAQRPPTC